MPSGGKRPGAGRRKEEQAESARRRHQLLSEHTADNSNRAITVIQLQANVSRRLSHPCGATPVADLRLLCTWRFVSGQGVSRRRSLRQARMNASHPNARRLARPLGQDTAQQGREKPLSDVCPPSP